MKLRLCLLVVLLVTGASTKTKIEAHAGPEDDPTMIGWVKPVRRQTYLLRSGRPDSEVKTLRPGRDAGEPLHGGDKVRCDPGGGMMLNIYGTETSIAGSNDWRVLPFLPPPNDSVRAALMEYAHVGGRRRPGAQAILSPAKESKVSLRTLTFRWVPRPGRILLSIATETGQRLWQQARIPGVTGQLVSVQARQRLKAFRSAGGRGFLILSLAGGGADQPTVRFQLLTADEETQLEKELVVMGTQTTGILKHVGRAGIFNRYEMHAQVADEYTQALAMEPLSIYLIRKTAEAYRTIGDSQRFEQLKRRLPPGVDLVESDEAGGSRH